MIGTIIKATFNTCERGGFKTGTNTIIKTYKGIDDHDIKNQIARDVGKYGYTKVEPLTNEQYEQLTKEK
jgi:hypothetical protein